MHLLQAIPVRPQITKREGDAGGFLHAQKSVKGPFPVELLDLEAMLHSRIGDNVLASIVALAGAIPEE